MNNNKILELIYNPEDLEMLYQQQPEQFVVWFDEALQQFPQSDTLLVWKARLSYKQPVTESKHTTSLLFVVVISLVAGILSKLPGFLPITESWFYPRFVPIIIFSSLIFYFTRQYKNIATCKIIISGLVLCGLFMSVLPSDSKSASLVMSTVHLPLVLTTLLGLAFMADNWRIAEARLHYIRYIGEMIIYATLILIGGMILTFITLGLFSLIDLSIDQWYIEYVVVFGLVASPIVGTYLYDSVLGSESKLATLLSNIFSPLFLITIFIYLLAIMVEGKSPYSDRDFLITFNGLLVVIWAISVFSISGKSQDTDSKLLDYSNIALLALTLLINAIALSAIIFRWAEHGITPNRVVVSGANILIFSHLILILREYIRYVKVRDSSQALINAVGRYLPIYSAWSLFVVFVLPLLFWFE